MEILREFHGEHGCAAWLAKWLRTHSEKELFSEGRTLRALYDMESAWGDFFRDHMDTRGAVFVHRETPRSTCWCNFSAMCAEQGRDAEDEAGKYRCSLRADGSLLLVDVDEVL